MDGAGFAHQPLVELAQGREQAGRGASTSSLHAKFCEITEQILADERESADRRWRAAKILGAVRATEALDALIEDRLKVQEGKRLGLSLEGTDRFEFETHRLRVEMARVSQDLEHRPVFLPAEGVQRVPGFLGIRERCTAQQCRHAGGEVAR